MAEKVILVDDFDTGNLSDETLYWVHPDGDLVRNDLTDTNAKQLREVLEPFLAVGQKLGKHKLPKRKAKGKVQRHRIEPVTDEPEPDQELDDEDGPLPVDADRWWVEDRGTDSRGDLRRKKEYRMSARAWAVENGFSVPIRGALADAVMFAYGRHRKSQGQPVGPAAMGLS